MPSERQLLEHLVQQGRTIERLLMMVLGVEERILMDEATAVDLLQKTVTLIQALESNQTVDHLADPEVQSALTELKTVVDAAQAQSPTLPTGDEPVPGDGTPSAG